MRTQAEIGPQVDDPDHIERSKIDESMDARCDSDPGDEQSDLPNEPTAVRFSGPRDAIILPNEPIGPENVDRAVFEKLHERTQFPRFGSGDDG